MKKYISLVLIISLIFFVSCSGNPPENSETDRPLEQISEENLVINIYRPPVGDLKGFNNVSGWEEYIKERFGIEMKINYISPLHQSAITTGDYYPGAIREGKVSGLIELDVNAYRNIPTLMEEGLILPLDEYLAGNEAFLSLSPIIRDAFIMNDGKMWAFSGNNLHALGTRGFRTSWLEALELEVPGNLDELYEVSKAFAYNDPNGNGENDEHGMDFAYRTGIRMLIDLFMANGCYVSNYGACSIAFDHNTGAYEDAALKPGMTDTVAYIKNLYDEGILHSNLTFDFVGQIGYGNCFDYSNFKTWDIDRDEWTFIYSLNEDPYKSVTALKPTNCFVLTSNTENPAKVINEFVSAFFGSAEGLALGSYGVPGSDFTIDANTLTHIYKYENTYGQSNFYNENIALSGMNYELLYSMGFRLESEFFEEDFIDRKLRQQELIGEMLLDDMIFTDSFYLPHPNYKAVQTSFVNTMFQYFYEDMGPASPEELIDNYLDNQKKAGAEQILYEMNEKLGVSSTYNYRP